jgi:tRNA(fMet)-specific endonuclease VapC
LVKKGGTIGAHDLMIASTAVSLGFSVITTDIRDFEKIPGLKIERFTP